MPKLIIPALMLIAISTAVPVQATLGGPAASVQADQQSIAPQSQLSQQSTQAYDIEQMKTADGVTVREYVGPTQTVFAVTWRGPHPPNLAVLLGDYFAQYQAGAAKSTSIHRRRTSTDNLVVESGGHMLDMWGRAYVPNLVPAGVTPEDIQ